MTYIEGETGKLNWDHVKLKDVLKGVTVQAVPTEDEMRRFRLVSDNPETLSGILRRALGSKGDDENVVSFIGSKVCPEGHTSHMVIEFPPGQTLVGYMGERSAGPVLGFIAELQAREVTPEL